MLVLLKSQGQVLLARWLPFRLNVNQLIRSWLVGVLVGFANIQAKMLVGVTIHADSIAFFDEQSSTSNHLRGEE